MTTTATAVPLPDVPLDVLEFAGEREATWRLRPVLNVTRTAFPNAPISLRIADDPEIPNDRRIVVEVDVTGWSTDQMWQARSRWSDLFAEVASPVDTGVFRLRLAVRA
jgi:hypothetical protein